MASGSSSFSPSLNAVVLAERRVEVLLNQRADLLRRTVVGVVVAGREGVGAQDDPALDLVAETGSPGGAHDAFDGHGTVPGEGAQAEPDAVELCEVGGRLGRHDQVIGAQCVLEVGAGDLNDLGAGLLEEFQ
jgi:hypothetical protein